MIDKERRFSILIVISGIFLILMLTFFTLFIMEKSNKSTDVTSSSGSSICYSAACRDSAKFISEALNTSVDPCEDFYQYSCGKWLLKNPIPKDAAQYGILDGYVPSRINKKLKALLQQDIKSSKDSQAVDNAKLLYQGCIITNFSAGNSNLQYLQETTKNFGWPIITSNWQTNDMKWWEVIAKMKNEFGIDVLLRTSVKPSFLNSSKYSIYLEQVAPQGLHVDYRTRQQNQAANSKNQENHPYVIYISKVACFLNETFCGNVTTDAEDILNFIVHFQQAYKTSFLTKTIQKGVLPGDEIFRAPEILRSDKVDPKEYIMSIGTLNSKIPDVDWLKFLQTVFKNSGITVTNDTEVIAPTEDLHHVIKKVTSTSRRIIHDVIVWHFVNQIGQIISEDIRKLNFDFNVFSTGVESQKTIIDFCLELTTPTFGWAVASLYASSLTDSDISYAKDLIMNIRKGAAQRLNENDWLDAPTKAAALTKLNEMIARVAVPDFVKNSTLLNSYYEPLGKFSKTDFLRNILEARKLNVRRDLLRLTMNVDRNNDWLEGNPMTTNAFYFTNFNAFYLLAGIMEHPIFQSNSLESINFGSVGYVIGHEIFHGFDATGSLFDEKGNLRNWWTKESQQKYLLKQKCMIDQYSSITEELTDSRVNHCKSY